VHEQDLSCTAVHQLLVAYAAALAAAAASCDAAGWGVFTCQANCCITNCSSTHVSILFVPTVTNKM
jgi:hypothetical protein